MPNRRRSGPTGQTGAQRVGGHRRAPVGTGGHRSTAGVALVRGLLLKNNSSTTSNTSPIPGIWLSRPCSARDELETRDLSPGTPGTADSPDMAVFVGPDIPPGGSIMARPPGTDRAYIGPDHDTCRWSNVDST